MICFDEATVRWCLDNKKMLQGPEMPLTMGDSNTGCHSYTVELNGIMMVVCSNSWTEELKEPGSFKEGEKDYLHNISFTFMSTSHSGRRLRDMADGEWNIWTF